MKELAKGDRSKLKKGNFQHHPKVTRAETKGKKRYWGKKRGETGKGRSKRQQLNTGELREHAQELSHKEKKTATKRRSLNL